MSKVFIDESTLTAIGDAIREKTGGSELIAPLDMADEISSIESGSGGGYELPDEAFVISGDCNYRFANGGWDWFIEGFGDKITTKDINNATYMFSGSNVEKIPFEINFKSSSPSHDIGYMFNVCTKLLSIPKMNNCVPFNMVCMFSHCYNLRQLPDNLADWFDWSYMEKQTSAYTCSRNYAFQYCCSLRSFPMEFLNHGNPIVVYSFSIYYGCFSNCYSLDEIIGLPFPHLSATWTSNAFTSTFNQCNRVKDITFALQEDGTPYSVNWKNQTIDLSIGVGYGSAINITNHNSGITADKRATDDTTYQALKNDPDWFTTITDYSRYNHDSAVNTINSLPDTSAYLASAGGTNTIKFKGQSGALTDGGAINTLTEEEISVAVNKGWTVTFS